MDYKGLSKGNPNYTCQVHLSGVKVTYFCLLMPLLHHFYLGARFMEWVLIMQDLSLINIGRFFKKGWGVGVEDC